MTLQALVESLTTYTVALEDVAADDLPRVGGKGANLGALVRAGVSVPPGYCVTTEAFDGFIRLALIEALHEQRLQRADPRIAAVEAAELFVQFVSASKLRPGQ